MATLPAMLYATNTLTAPTLAMLRTFGADALEALPPILHGYKSAVLQVLDFPEDKVVDKLGLDSPYELLAMFENGALFLYRRPILDVWCESARPLDALVYEVVVSELGQAAQLSDEEIAALCDPNA